MTLALYTHLDMLDHQPGHGHVESPRAPAGGDRRPERRPEPGAGAADAPLVDVEDLLRVHPPAFVDAVSPPRPALADGRWTRTPCCRRAA
ncbi:hypothetical protein ACRAWD_10950 [Caulobacter segnis]